MIQYMKTAIQYMIIIINEFYKIIFTRKVYYSTANMHDKEGAE